MKSKKILAVAAFSLLLLSGLAAFDIGSASISISSEAVASPGLALVTIRAVPSGTQIIVDGGMIGYSSWSGTLTPGHHLISASAADHYAAQFPFVVQENTKYSISIRLEPHTGYLAIDVTPADAAISVDGTRVYGNLIELPVGYHSVVVKKFGFNEEKAPLTILWHRTSTLSIGLSPSAFEISAYRLKPESFNPLNKGIYNRAGLSFSVTAPGYGSILIADDAGRTVYSEALPVFATWSQHFIWRGTDAKGTRLPDGEYDLKLSLWPLPSSEGQGSQQNPGYSEAGQNPALPAISGSEGEPAASYSSKVKIDSSLRIVPSGSSAARPGLLYFANPAVSELFPGSAELTGSFPSGASLSLGFKVGNSAMLAIEGVYDTAPGGAVAGSLLRNIVKSPTLDLALFARLAWSGAIVPTYPGSASEAELALPFALAMGNLRIGVAPGLVYDLRNATLAPRASAGIWYENPGLSAGISAQGSFGTAPFMSSGNPLLAAVEARTLFDRLPFTFLFRLSGAFEPELTKPAASIGFGVAW